MLYKMSLCESEIPPLFVQLDELDCKDPNENPSWKEKARYAIIFMEEKINKIKNFN